MTESWHERAWVWFVGHAKGPYALPWLALVAFTDAIFFPIAPEVFLVALTVAHRDRWKQYLSVALAASVAGSIAGYFIAAFLFREFGAPILAFYGLEGAFHAARHILHGHIFFAMIFASFTPIPDKVFIYAAGFLGTPLLPFVVGYAIGRALRMAATVALAYRFGAQALDIIKRYLLIFGALFLVLAIIYAMVHWHLVPGL